MPIVSYNTHKVSEHLKPTKYSEIFEFEVTYILPHLLGKEGSDHKRFRMKLDFTRTSDNSPMICHAGTDFMAYGKEIEDTRERILSLIRYRVYDGVERGVGIQFGKEVDENGSEKYPIIDN
jgi:hypothetical protein